MARLQAALAKAGHPTAARSDTYDDDTRRVVASFQQEHGIPSPSGLQAGPKTLSTLDDHLRGGPPRPAARIGCRYGPGEKEASASSDGAVEVLGDRAFLLTDFTPGRASLKPAHKRFLTKLLADFLLTNPFGDDVANTSGNTDCVSEDVVADNQLRFARAAAVVTFLNFLGALDGRTSAAQEPRALISGGNETPLGRAHNRHARIDVSKVPPPPTSEEPKKKPPPPGLRPVPEVQTFLVRVTGGIGVGKKVVGIEGLQLTVVDVDQGLQADYHYGGGGLGVSLLPVNGVLPGAFTKVIVRHRTATDVATLESFAGGAALFGAGGGQAGVTLLAVGRGFGTISLESVSLTPGVSLTSGLIEMFGNPRLFDPKSVIPDGT